MGTDDHNHGMLNAKEEQKLCVALYIKRRAFLCAIHK